jgi:hypothetical protein
MVKSAVASVTGSGALVTLMPRAVQAAIAMLSYPTSFSQPSKEYLLLQRPTNQRHCDK